MCSHIHHHDATTTEISFRVSQTNDSKHITFELITLRPWTSDNIAISVPIKLIAPTIHYMA